MAREAPHKQQQLAHSLPGAEATFGLPSSSCSFHVSLVLASSKIVQGMTQTTHISPCSSIQCSNTIAKNSTSVNIVFDLLNTISCFLNTINLLGNSERGSRRGPSAVLNVLTLIVPLFKSSNL